MKDEHTDGKKMARNGRNMVIYKGTFVSNHSLPYLTKKSLISIDARASKINIDSIFSLHCVNLTKNVSTLHSLKRVIHLCSLASEPSHIIIEL